MKKTYGFYSTYSNDDETERDDKITDATDDRIPVSVDDGDIKIDLALKEDAALELFQQLAEKLDEGMITNFMVKWTASRVLKML